MLDVSIIIKDGAKAVYVSLDKLNPLEKQRLLEYLKNGDFEQAAQFMNKMEQSSEIITDYTKATTERSIFDPLTLTEKPLHLEQKSLGINEDFGAKPNIEDVYEKATKGDAKALRMVASWAQQRDPRAIGFLRSLQDQRRKPMQRERVIIP